MYITDYLENTYSTEALIEIEEEINQDSISRSCYLSVQLALINNKIKSGEIECNESEIFACTMSKYLAPTLKNKLKDDRKFLLENIGRLEHKIQELERKSTNGIIQNVNSFSREVVEEPKRVKVFQENKEEFFMYVSCKGNEINRNGNSSKLNVNLFGFLLNDMDRLNDLNEDELRDNLRIVTSSRQIEKISENLTYDIVCDYCILKVKLLDQVDTEYSVCDRIPST